MKETEAFAFTGESVEVSFVMPCLDEAETPEACIAAARRCIDRHGPSTSSRWSAGCWPAC